MEIRTATERDYGAVAGLLAEADDARVITEESLRHWAATRPERAQSLELVAVDGTGIVGFGGASLNIWTSTAGAGSAFVFVTASRRREGTGTAIGERLLAHLRDRGATTVTTFIRQTDEGERWATRRGFARVITGPLIAVDPRTTPEPELPDGFRCVPLSQLTPEAVYDAMIESALDEPSAEPNDAIELSEFAREWDDPLFDLESATAVLHGDEVVAFTFMKVADGRAQHGFTGCARAYRGRGLATAAKRAALRSVAARGVTRVTTSNAEENAAMRAINRRLGFEQIGEHVIMKREL